MKYNKSMTGKGMKWVGKRERVQEMETEWEMGKATGNRRGNGKWKRGRDLG